MAVSYELFAILAGCITMAVSSAIYLLTPRKRHKIHVAPQPKRQFITQEGHVFEIQTSQTNSPPTPPPILSSEYEKDLKTLRYLGIELRPQEREQRPHEESSKPQPPTMPVKEIYICIECGRRYETVERVIFYKKGVGRIQVERCPYCGAIVGPAKIIEPEERTISSIKPIEIKANVAPPTPESLGIEHPALESKEKEEIEEEVEDASEA